MSGLLLWLVMSAIGASVSEGHASFIKFDLSGNPSSWLLHNPFAGVDRVRQLEKTEEAVCPRLQRERHWLVHIKQPALAARPFGADVGKYLGLSMIPLNSPPFERKSGKQPHRGKRDISGGRLAGVHEGKEGCPPIALYPLKRWHPYAEISAKLLFGGFSRDFIRFSRLIESHPNKPNTSEAKEHPTQRRNAHNAGPQRGFPLRYKIGLIVFVYALIQLGLYAFARKAIDEQLRGDAPTGVAYLLICVFGVISSSVGGVLLISGLIDQSYGY